MHRIHTAMVPPTARRAQPPIAMTSFPTHISEDAAAVAQRVPSLYAASSETNDIREFMLYPTWCGGVFLSRVCCTVWKRDCLRSWEQKFCAKQFHLVYYSRQYVLYQWSMSLSYTHWLTCEQAKTFLMRHVTCDTGGVAKWAYGSGRS